MCDIFKGEQDSYSSRPDGGLQIRSVAPKHSWVYSSFREKVLMLPNILTNFIKQNIPVY